MLQTQINSCTNLTTLTYTKVEHARSWSRTRRRNKQSRFQHRNDALTFVSLWHPDLQICRSLCWQKNGQILVSRATPPLDWGCGPRRSLSSLRPCACARGKRATYRVCRVHDIMSMSWMHADDMTWQTRYVARLSGPCARSRLVSRATPPIDWGCGPRD